MECVVAVVRISLLNSYHHSLPYASACVRVCVCVCACVYVYAYVYVRAYTYFTISMDFFPSF